MFALRVPTLVSIGFVAGLKGFTAAVIGGIGSIPGAMAGGLILGFAESYTQGYITTKWSDLIVFSILILFMLFRPQGLLGTGGHQEGMSMSDSTPTAPRRPPTGPPSGRTSGSRATPSGRSCRRAARDGRGAAAPRPLVGVARALRRRSSRCCRSFESSGYVRRVGFDTVLYMLLALGLNVVVGWGGLLDLGFVAFYGIGAYTYAILDSDKFGIHLPTLVAVPFVVVVGALAGLLLGLPSRRLTGDYLAIVTLFFLQLFQTLTTNGDSVFGHNVTGGPNGILNVDPFSLFGHELVVAARRRLRGLVPLRRARVLRRRLRRAALREPSRAPAAPGARSARTRSRPRRWACRSTG